MMEFFILKDWNSLEFTNIYLYNIIASQIGDSDAFKKIIEKDKGEEYQNENYYSQDDYAFKAFLDLGKKLTCGHLFTTTTDEVYSRYKFINDKKCWHNLKYLREIKMKYQKLSLIPTKNLDNLASFGRVVTFPFQLISIGICRYNRINDGFNLFPL